MFDTPIAHQDINVTSEDVVFLIKSLAKNPENSDAFKIYRAASNYLELTQMRDAVKHLVCILRENPEVASFDINVNKSMEYGDNGERYFSYMIRAENVLTEDGEDDHDLEGSYLEAYDPDDFSVFLDYSNYDEDISITVRREDVRNSGANPDILLEQWVPGHYRGIIESLDIHASTPDRSRPKM